MKSKSFFEHHGEEVDKEHVELETYQEKTKVEFPKCRHTSVDFVGNELVCSCGNAWMGTAGELQTIYKALTK